MPIFGHNQTLSFLGILVSLPDADALGNSIRAAVEQGIPVITINSGLDSSAGLGALMHVGQPERLAGEKAGVHDGPIEFAELHAPFTHQEKVLRDALALGDDVTVNPSGGALCANPMMTTGLTRVGEAASYISSGRARRGIAHATSGPCLQQNLVCVLEAE